MLRILLLALLIWSTLRLAGRWLNHLLSAGDSGRVEGRSGGGPPSVPPALLSRCPTCGLHFAAETPASGGEGAYCSPGCRQAAEAGPS